MSRVLLLLSLTLGLLARPCAADTTVRQVKGAATLEVRIPDPLTIADTIAATLIVDAAPDASIQPPRELADTTKWLLVQRLPEEREPLRDGLVRWRQTYLFAPSAPGEATFTFPDVKLRDAKGDENLYFWDEIPMHVAAPTIAADLKGMRGNTGIEASAPIPEAANWSRWWLLTPVVPVAAAVIAFAFLWRRRHARVSAEERALYELRRLTALKLPERGKAERFATLLTMLLREYLERALELPARRQTTRELLESCVRSSRLTNDERRFLETILVRCDTVKFAGIAMPASECSWWAEQTRTFIEGRRVETIRAAEKLGKL